MQMLRTYFYRRILLLIGLFFTSYVALAGPGGGVVKAMGVLDGGLHQIRVDSARTVQDSAFFNASYTGSLDTAYAVQNIVTVKINEATLVYLRSAFQVTIRMRVISTGSAGLVDSLDRDFTVKYDSVTTYDGRSSMTFSGGRKVTIKVLSVTSNVSAWDAVSALVIENQVITRPRFIFSCTSPVTSITISPSSDTATDELPVNWTTVLGADQYDLEWTYVDASAIRANGYIFPRDLALVFLNNASRTTLSGTSYNIPLMYDDSGSLLIRIRPVQAGPGNSVTAAAWSSEASTPVYGRYDFYGHQRALNWQSNISYAEEGKRKVVVQYFDGSLRSRQTVTKDNTTNTTLIAETYYDYQGRPAIQVMPSPTLNNTIKYTSGFNVSYNSPEYSQSNYDSLPGSIGYCDVHADSMQSVSGASQYYSTNNPGKYTGMNQFIPNASGYPFTETEYTADNTGRISRQGGVGSGYQLGSGHETKYYYGSPDQNELDALFGTEVGDHSHYFKNMVRDANGQYSVSYVDMHGRTIATALTGLAPSSLAPLASNISRTVTETLLDSNSLLLQDLSMSSQKSLLVPVADSFHFHYNLLPDIYQAKNCQNANICYTCRYDLEVSITDNCGNQLLPGAKAYDTVIHNFSLAGISNSCTVTPINLDFTLYFPEGNYLVTKKLTASRDAYNYYRDSVYVPGNTCTTLQQTVDNQRILIAAANTQCVPDCSTCRSDVGTWPVFLQRFITNSGLSYPADTAAYRGEALAAYNSALAACDALCQDKASDDNDIRKAMLQDMTPPFGQYADTTIAPNKDVYSIFYQRAADTTYIPTYRLDAINYLDDQGKQDSVYNERSDLMVEPNSLSISQFVQNFRPSWAEALLPYHPEYCKLLAMQAQNPSNQWDRRMEAVDDYQTAYSQGLLNPTGKTGVLPFSNYAPQSGNIDPLFATASSMRTAIENKMKVYQPAESTTPALSIWALACTMVKCGSTDAPCIVFYANNNPGYDFGTQMCDGDRDMAWRFFRQMYLGIKHDILFQQLIDQPQGCSPSDRRAYKRTPKAAELFAAKHNPEFTDSKNSSTSTSLVDVQKATNPGAANNLVALMNDSLSHSYDANCHAYAQVWSQQLSTCLLYSATELNNVIIPRLYTLCRAACDADHPFGASTLPSGVNYPGQSWRSFQDIIKAYNTANGINDALHCNAELITAPQPYDNQSALSAKPVYSRPADCECKLITDLYNRYRLTGRGDASFSAYLLRTQQVSMTDADLNTLRAMCGNTTNSSTCTFLSAPINLPPSMQCNTGSVCTSCQAVGSLYSSYQSTYPGNIPAYISDGDTVQTQKNKLFQNYMNNHLGFSKQAWEYLQFMDTCSAHTADTATVRSCADSVIASLFSPGGASTFSDMRRTADSGYIIVGTTTAGGTGMAGVNAYVVRTNKAGVVQWSKIYGGTQTDNFIRVRPTSDNGYIAIGSTLSASHPTGDMLIVKMNAAGGTQWIKTVGVGSTSGERGFDIIQTRDGGYAALGMYNYAAGVCDLLAAKLDSTGSTAWVRNFGTTTSDDASGIFERQDTLIVTGYTYDENARYFGTLFKLKEDSGRVFQQLYYGDFNDSSMSTYFSNIYPTSNGYMLSTLSASLFGSDSARLGVLRIRYDGSIIYNVRFGNPQGMVNDYVTTGGISQTLDGGSVGLQSNRYSSHIFWQKLDSSGNFQWSRQTSLPGTQYAGAVIQSADSTYTVSGKDNDSLFYFRASSTGATGCYDAAATLNITHPQLRIVPGGNGDAFSDSARHISAVNATLAETFVNSAASAVTCPGSSNTCYTIYNGPTLCGKAAPVFSPATPSTVTACTDSTFFAVSKGTNIYNHYTDSLTGSFEQAYLKKCLQAYKIESFTVTHSQREHHYTLYYYDQAGNLLKTIPPAGVQQFTDTNDLKLVRAARAINGVKTPTHTLATNYRYNSLNQVVAQRSPDGGGSRFWYDRLGRLVLSQNARQKPNNQYSYTQYDSIGRIVQVGQLVSATAITDVISRNESSLLAWENSVSSSADQITLTTYDSSNYAIIPELSPRNLRNRVAWTALYNTASDLASGLQAAASYYSYDILGNVDTLVQDFKKGSMAANGNRFKKITYDFDLVSGKVNQVSFQQGFSDGFYHTYLYDAENRITNVQSSTDSINWDNDAWYSYYAHGPLARTILGQQQVQGVNYAYTLQGWLKAINPDVYTGGSYTLRPDSLGHVVAASAYNLLLNYYDGDYKPISGVAGPDNGVAAALTGSYKALFNGNISSMGTRVRGLDNTLLYSYQYDQLNRLVAMDAWNKTGAAWSALSPFDDFKERIAYDPNGNILQYLRNGNHSFAGKPLAMDSLGYKYIAGSNKLDHISDAVVPTSPAPYDDIQAQSTGNYKYDSIGQLTSDDAAGIANISWTVYGKIASITRGGDTTIYYTYDPGGNRISKSLVHGTDTTTTWYVRDAQGNVLSVYTYGDPAIHGRDLTQTELHIYGSSRLGILKMNRDVEAAPTDTLRFPTFANIGNNITFTRGNKLFELTNHLGNVLATISDKRFGLVAAPSDTTVAYFIPDLVSANDYYPFGMLQPYRSYAKNGASYRYGFNGKENDNEVKGTGDQIDYGDRIYDPRIGRWLSVDPASSKYPDLTPYGFAGNSPIELVDKKGKEPDRNQAGTIDQASGQWARLQNQTVDGILDYIQHDRNAVRYVYSKDKGWIDLQHYFATMKYGKTAMDLIEPASGSEVLQKYVFGPGANESYFSYEDLPSNQFASDNRISIISKDPKTDDGIPLTDIEEYKTGSELISSVKKNFTDAKATNPEDAPNWKQIPFMDHGERKRLPEIKGYEKSDISVGVAGAGMAVPSSTPIHYTEEEQKKLLKTGKYIPQNHTSNPYNLGDFAPAPSSIQNGDKRKGVTGH